MIVLTVYSLLVGLSGMRCSMLRREGENVEPETESNQPYSICDEWDG